MQFSLCPVSIAAPTLPARPAPTLHTGKLRSAVISLCSRCDPEVFPVRPRDGSTQSDEHFLRPARSCGGAERPALFVEQRQPMQTMAAAMIGQGLRNGGRDRQRCAVPQCRMAPLHSVDLWHGAALYSALLAQLWQLHQQPTKAQSGALPAVPWSLLMSSVAACSAQVALPAAARQPESWFMMAGFLKCMLMATTSYGAHFAV